MDEHEKEMERGLFAAFRPAEGESVLESIERLHGAVGSVFLRDADDGASPVSLRRDDGDPAKDDSRYQLLGEIARGGIGVVYKGRDKDLNRDIALKVLRPEFADREDVVQRFIEEAQVGGQLQHPGIVPIYGIGLQDDGRPSFAMKLIKGRTLAELLVANPKGVDLLAVFEQIAQTMAYAHSRGVIHRDLKPANIMVGAFGEVQVVDWGFAKVLGQEELPRPERTRIVTVRSEAEGSQSIAGSVMGTPAYMPPEQAMGQIDDLDERSDVFALGAILCEVLTGKAPYGGPQKDQLIAASQCLLGPALERLDAADADNGLKKIVRACLQPLMSDRPRSGVVVSEALKKHFATVEERARRSELASLKAAAAAEKERRGRKRALILAGVALVAVLIGGGGYISWKRDADARLRAAAPQIAAAMREATGAEGRRDWTTAVDAARKAVALAASNGVDDAGADTLLARLEKARDAADSARRKRERDDAFLARLQSIRANRRPSRSDTRRTDKQYREAFKERFGSLAASARALAASPHAAEYAANLAFWRWLKRAILKEHGWEDIHRLALKVDPENAELHEALATGDAATLLAAIEKRGDALSIALAAQVGLELKELGHHDEAIAFLQGQLDRAPGDYWLHARLAHIATDARRNDLALPHATAATAVHPEDKSAWANLALYLINDGDAEAALRVSKRLLREHPDDMFVRTAHFAAVAEAEGVKAALPLAEREVAREPDSARALHTLAIVVSRHGDFGRAAQLVREAIKRNPSDPSLHALLSGFLYKTGDVAGCIAAARACLRLNPRHADGLVNLTVALLKSDVPAALEAARRAVAAVPHSAQAQMNLGVLLASSGDTANCLRHLRRAVEIDPEYALGRNALGWALVNLQHYEEGIAHLCSAAILDPSIKQVRARLAEAFKRRYGPSLAYVGRGGKPPEDPRERLGIAELCYYAKRYPTALRFYRLAFEAEPQLAPRYGYHAAGAAAASGKEHRAQALAWLRGYLGWLRWREPREIVGVLGQWKRDDALVEVDPSVNEDLGEEWTQLWKDAESMLAKAKEAK